MKPVKAQMTTWEGFVSLPCQVILTLFITIIFLRLYPCAISDGRTKELRHDVKEFYRACWFNYLKDEKKTQIPF